MTLIPLAVSTPWFCVTEYKPNFIPYYHVPAGITHLPPCTLVSMSSSISACPAVLLKRLHLECVMRWDVLQWAGKWRSVHHSWVMRWHTLKHYTPPQFMNFIQSKGEGKEINSLCTWELHRYIQGIQCLSSFFSLSISIFSSLNLPTSSSAWK